MDNNYNEDDYCCCCESETDYATTYYCSICKRFCCTNCKSIFYESDLYTVCRSKKCGTIHEILKKYFCHDIESLIITYYSNALARKKKK